MDTERQKLFNSYQKAKDCPGKTHYLRFLQGEKLTLKQSVIADCFICTAGFLDGKVDCSNPSCVLYPFMPYRKNKEKVKTVRTEKQQENDRRLSFLRSTNKQSKGLQEKIV
jgi:F420-0:gamma-glutamyl ligase